MPNYYYNELRLIEADVGEPGTFRVLMIKPGISLNGVLYSEALLRSAAPLFEGARSFARSDQEHRFGEGVDAKNIIGFFRNVAFVEGQGLVGELHVMPSASWVTENLKNAIELGNLSLYGFSIVAGGLGHEEEIDGQSVVVVDEMTNAISVDLVVNPGAGGQVLDLAESDDLPDDATICIEAEPYFTIDVVDELVLAEAGPEQINSTEARLGAVARALDPTYEDRNMKAKLIALIKKSRPDLAEAQDLENLSEADLLNLVEGFVAPQQQHQQTVETNDQQDVSTGGGRQVDTSAFTAAEARINQSLASLQRTEGRLLIAEGIAGANLPSAFAESVRTRLTRRNDAGEVITSQVIEAEIAEARGLIQAASQPGTVLGEGRVVEVREADIDKKVQWLDDFFERKPNAGSFRSLYMEATGDTGLTGHMSRDAHREMSRYIEAHDVQMNGGSVFVEAINTSVWDVILQDAINKAMVREYDRIGLQDWRMLADVVPLSDFRTQHRIRWGGYANLDIVAEGGAYLALTTPVDEEATYAPAKRGGTEVLTMEAIMNDDVRSVRLIPVRMGQAAAQTLHEFVLDTLDDNEVIYDALALFDGGHNNLNTTAFSADEYMVLRQKMRAQTELTNAKPLGIMAAHLWVPNELENSAFNAFRRQTNNDPDFAQSNAPSIHVIDYWTDANNWYVTAMPPRHALLEVGFVRGEQPAVFVQDNANVGSWFNSDERTYKIQHIYGKTVLDFRYAQGAIVA